MQFVNTFDVAAASAQISDIEFSSDGSLMFILTDGDIRAYDLSTPWDTSTATPSLTNMVYEPEVARPISFELEP
jgi:hypothetical protein